MKLLTEGRMSATKSCGWKSDAGMISDIVGIIRAMVN